MLKRLRAIAFVTSICLHTANGLFGASRTLPQNLPVKELTGEPQDATYQAYKTAQAFVYDQRWNEAITNLQGFLQKYPKSKYDDAAQFWIVYSREKRGDNAEQVFQAYKEFIGKYSRSNYVDD